MSGLPQTIELNAGIQGEPAVKEKLTAAALTPGHLVELTTSDTLQKHSTAAKTASKTFALTDTAVGGDIDTAYASGARARYGAFGSGQEVYALVAASAAAIVIDDSLESAGDGTLRKVVTDTATDDTQRNSIVAYAIEAVDNSGGGAEARIRVVVA